MSKPVNLKQARKRKARAEKVKKAEANRLSHGQPKAVTDLTKARAEKAARELDAKICPQMGAGHDKGSKFNIFEPIQASLVRPDIRCYAP